MVDTTEVDSFLASCAPAWGYRDIEHAIEAYKEAGKDEIALADDVKAWAEDTGTKLDDVDVCYVAYDSLYQEARTDIERETGKDICNDAPYDGVSVYGNYMCTGLDAKEGDSRALIDLIETIPEGNRTEVTKWLLSKLS